MVIGNSVVGRVAGPQGTVTQRRAGYPAGRSAALAVSWRKALVPCTKSLASTSAPTLRSARPSYGLAVGQGLQPAGPQLQLGHTRQHQSPDNPGGTRGMRLQEEPGRGEQSARATLAATRSTLHHTLRLTLATTRQCVQLLPRGKVQRCSPSVQALSILC